MREAQPLIRRLADRWLALPDQLFESLPSGRQQIWRKAVASELVLETLSATTFQGVERAWVKLAFELPTPADRAGITKVAKAVAFALFPGHTESRADDRLVSFGDPHEFEDEDRQSWPKWYDANAKRDQALKQVDAISAAVAEGHDAKAQRYLKELVSAQLSFGGGNEHIVKSLCNIAQQCAEMFRTDFEYECLETAIHIKPDDGWALVQLADHFKRVGRFDDAIATLRKAESFGKELMAKSSLADVYVRMRRFQKSHRHLR